MRKLALLFSLAFLAAGSLPAADLVLILDVSGSMWGQIDGENKIVIARRVLGELVDGLEDGQEAALVAYGHRREGDCEDIETVVPLGPLDRAGLKAKVEGLVPKGKTPITAALREAIGVVEGREAAATLVLVSDGLETCGGDPCKLVREARTGGIELILHVVGFDVAEEDVSQLECAAQAGGGLFLAADSADQLAAALEAAVALPAGGPSGRLSVKGTRDGELQDLAVRVSRAGTGEAVGGGRTYADPSTNPRIIPLEAGRYDVEVSAVGLRGEAKRKLEGVEIEDGGTVEEVFDFSAGELAVEVKRNGQLSDATVEVFLPGSSRSVAGGRTYRASASNPKLLQLTPGTYDVLVSSVEIAGSAKRRWEGVVVEPRSRVELSHGFESGDLLIEVKRGGELADALVEISDGAGARIDGGRTYAKASSNPKTFTLPPGPYKVTVKEVQGKGRETIEVAVTAGEESRRTVEFQTP